MRACIIASTTAAIASMAILSGCAAQFEVHDPKGPPTVGPSIPLHPPLDATDYAYTLTLLCQCRDGGSPVRVTVRDSEAVGAVYLETKYGREAGEVADDPNLLVTINDVIDAVNDVTAFHVDVDWPNSQDWPNRVNVDPEENTADEEYGYRVADVVIAS